MLLELSLLILANVVALAIILVAVMAHTVQFSSRMTLIATVLSLMIWQDMVYVSNHVAEHVLLLSNLTFIWPTLACLSFFLFIYQLGGNRKWRNKTEGAIGHILGSLVIAGTLIQFASQSFMELFSSGDTPALLVRGDGYMLYIAGLILTLLSVIGFLILEVVILRKRSQQYKAVLTVLYTVIAASTYGVFSNVILPLVSNSQTYASFGIVTVVVIAVGFTLSILRDRLLDIKLYVVRTVAYLLSLVTLVLVYSVITLSISRWLFRHDTSLLQNAINVMLIAISAFIFQPIRHFFDRITNRLFYSGSYDTDEFYAQLNRELSATNDMGALLRRASNLIAKTLKSEQVFFFVYYHNGSHVFTGTQGHLKPSSNDVAALDEFFTNKRNTVLIVDTLPSEEPMYGLLSRMRIAVVLPLRSTEGLIGHLYIGDQRKSKYTYRDINVLQTISDELVIAIQNARSVQEIKEFNATLQQRIADATKELRASNAQLQRLDAAKDEFVSMASHQLRTPLTSVKGYLSMVLEGDVGKVTSAQQKVLNEAFISSERMVHLINDFLNVSRIQTGKFILERRAVDLAKMVNQEVDSLQTTARVHDLKLKYRPPSHFPILYVDENKLRQVLMNFIDNAIYYSHEGTTIDVKLEIVGGDAILTVHDTGIGVPKSEQAHLFSKFFRATNARKQRPDGTGVGLFLAKKVIDAHGGSMVFESAEGEGSTFGFRLPIKKLSAAPDDNTNQLDK